MKRAGAGIALAVVICLPACTGSDRTGEVGVNFDEVGEDTALARQHAVGVPNAQRSVESPPRRSYEVICGRNFPIRNVYGTDAYASDSDVCTAAQHAGVIERGRGGVVVIEILPPRSGYRGSSANGIVSFDADTAARSFTVRAGNR